MQHGRRQGSNRRGHLSRGASDQTLHFCSKKYTQITLIYSTKNPKQLRKPRKKESVVRLNDADKKCMDFEYAHLRNDAQNRRAIPPPNQNPFDTRQK